MDAYGFPDVVLVLIPYMYMVSFWPQSQDLAISRCMYVHVLYMYMYCARNGKGQGTVTLGKCLGMPLLTSSRPSFLMHDP